jgi:hypothetical protein
MSELVYLAFVTIILFNNTIPFVAIYQTLDSRLEHSHEPFNKNLILNIKSKLNLQKPPKKKLESSIAYLLVFGELIPNKIISINIILAKVFSYSLMLEDITKPTLVTNPFIYN